MSTYLLTKDPGNPLMTIPIPGESKSQYVPHAVVLPNGETWVAVKGDESASIHAYRSTDGFNFTREGIMLAPTPGAWDSIYVSDPVLVVQGSTLHLYYKGNNTYGYGGIDLGHASAPVSDPMAMVKDANPILTSAAVLAFYQTNAPSMGLTEIRDLYLSDFILDPWGVPTWFGGFYGQAGTPYRISRFRGGWTSPAPQLGSILVGQAPYDFVQCPTVHLNTQTGRYEMWFTEGYDGSNNDLRLIKAAWCLPDGEWVWTRYANTLLSPGPGWDERKVFAGALLKGGPKYDTPILVNGAMRFFYSGTSHTSPNTAQAGAVSVLPVNLVTLG
jgi:hypothetical protein